MLAVRQVLPAKPNEKTPIVLVHGAANSAGVWTYWQQELAARGFASYALDLRGHGENSALDLRGHGENPALDLSRAGMEDYANDVHSVISQLDAKPVLMGWSMGGLVAMRAAARGDAIACVAFAPSPPARAIDASVALREGMYGAEEYGITSMDVHDQRAMPDLDVEERRIALASLCKESRWARDDRKRGVVIEAMPCPLLIVTGSADRQFPTKTYDGLWLPAERIEVAGASHWGLVLSRRAIGRVADDVVEWLDRSIGRGESYG